jgi:hypothetical protein
MQAKGTATLSSSIQQVLGHRQIKANEVSTIQTLKMGLALARSR